MSRESSLHVLVTGSASGIGLQTAVRFAEAGALVGLVDVQDEAVAAAARGAATSGARDAYPIVADLCAPGSASAIIGEAWEHGPVDVLVNAAGRYPATPFLELDAQIWDAVQQVNVRAPLLLTVEFARRAISAGRRGSVVNVTSGAALRARPGAAPYSTSKAALEMVTRASALELGPHGIRVNAVSPGFVAVDSAVNPVTEEYARAVSPNPLGRVGTPDDIARAIQWLSSDAAEWITGSILRVDGGASTGAHSLPAHWATNTVRKEEAQV